MLNARNLLSTSIYFGYSITFIVCIVNNCTLISIFGNLYEPEITTFSLENHFYSAQAFAAAG